MPRAKTPPMSTSVAKILKGERKRVKKMILREAEHRQFDVTALNQGPVDYNGALLSLADVSQGDDITNRQGRVITPTKLEFKMDIKAPAWGAGYYAQTRVIIFQDTENLGADPTAADLLESIGSGYSILSPYDRQFVIAKPKRFKILYDKVKDLNYGNNFVARFFKNITRLSKIEYTGSAANANGKNMLFLLIITDQPPSVGNPVNYDLYSRLHFADS